MNHRYLRPLWWARRLTVPAEKVLPAPFVMSLRAQVERVAGEPELGILATLAPPDAIALDIGAADGVYTWFLTQLTKGCVAFEANPLSAKRVRARVPSATVHSVALSDKNGEAQLRIPIERGVPLTGLASIELANTQFRFEKINIVHVPTRTLDSFNLPSVGFIKIDVEGHELTVLQGAQALIRRDRPILLIEVEDAFRPNARSKVSELLATLGYDPPEQALSPQNLIFRPRGAAIC